MYPCLMVFASIQVLIVIQRNEVTKDLVEMPAHYGCTIPILRDSTVVCRQPLNDRMVNMLLNDV